MQVVVLVVPPPRARAVNRQQPARGQLAQDPHHADRRDRVRRHDLAQERQRGRTVEHGEPPEHGRLVGVEQRVAALGDAAHPVAALPGKPGQVVEQVGHGHDGELRAGQLDRERQAAAAPAQLGDERRGRLVDGKLAAACPDPVGQQPHLVARRELGRAARAGRRERRDVDDPLRLGGQRYAAGDDEGQRRAGGQQARRERRRPVEHRLAAVEHEHGPAERREVAGDQSGRVLGADGEAERHGGFRRDELVPVDRGSDTHSRPPLSAAAGQATWRPA